MVALSKKIYDKPRQHIKKQRHYFANKGLSSQSCGISSSQVWKWELDHKEGWAPKKWCFSTAVLEKTLESPLDWKEIQPVHPKGNLPSIFIGRTDAKAGVPILWPPDAKSWLTGKRPWCWERLKVRGDEGDRGWVGWMTSLTQWTWVWARSGRRWRTGKPGMLQSMGSRTVRQGWAAEQQQQDVLSDEKMPPCSRQIEHKVKYIKSIRNWEGQRYMKVWEDMIYFWLPLNKDLTPELSMESMMGLCHFSLKWQLGISDHSA